MVPTTQYFITVLFKAHTWGYRRTIYKNVMPDTRRNSFIDHPPPIFVEVSPFNIFPNIMNTYRF